MPYLSIPGLLSLLLLYRAVPLGNPNFAHGKSTAQWRSLGDQAGPLVLITAIVILRSVSGLGFGTFLTLMAQERGLGLVAGGIPLGIYNIAGVVGALVVGYLADRIDPKPLVWGSLLCSVPPLYAFIYVEGMLASYSPAFCGRWSVAVFQLDYGRLGPRVFRRKIPAWSPACRWVLAGV